MEKVNAINMLAILKEAISCDDLPVATLFSVLCPLAKGILHVLRIAFVQIVTINIFKKQTNKQTKLIKLQYELCRPFYS